jgi:hypothetical protein
MVYNIVITKLSYALLWVLIVSLLSYILLSLVSWCVVSVVSLLSYIMSWPLLYSLVACTHGTHNPLPLKLDKEVVEGILLSLSTWLAPIPLCSLSKIWTVYVYADFIYDCINYFACQRKQIYLIRILFRFSVLLMLLYWQPDISSMQSPQQQTPYL